MENAPVIEIPLSPEAFAQRRAQLLEQHGLALTGDEGTLEKSGVRARYRYAEGLLSVEILEKPFFVSAAYCEGELRRFLGVA